MEEFSNPLPADTAQPLVVYCRSGRRATLLQAALTELGYREVRVLPPQQTIWAGDLPVFDCGVPAEPEPDLITTLSTSE